MIFALAHRPDFSGLHVRSNFTFFPSQFTRAFAVTCALTLLTPLQGWAQPKDSRLLGQHADPVMSLAFAANGKELFSGSARSKDISHAGKVWEIPDGKEKRTFRGGRGMWFSPDAKLMAILDDKNRTAEVLDTTTGQVRFKLEQMPVNYAKVTFSPKNQILAVAGENDDAKTLSVSLRDLATGKQLCSFGKWETQVSGLAFSPDGKRLVSTSLDGSVQVWDVNTGVELMKLISPEERSGGAVNDAAFSADGRFVAAACQNGVQVWEVATYKLVAKLPWAGYAPAHCVAFSPDGHYLAAASDCQGMAYFLRAWFVVVWNTDGWKPRFERKGRIGEADTVYKLVFSPDSSFLAFCTFRGFVGLIETQQK
jgi:WD40 repeat protein